MQAVTEEKLAETEVEFMTDKAACCVVMASGGYPEAYEKGKEIVIGDVESEVYIAGAAINEGKLVTAGGRVLGVTAVADTLKEAIDKAYVDVKKISFDKGFYRNDIGQKALNA